MDLPFTAEQFFGVFARYNVAVWPAQVVLTLLALAAVALVGRARSWGGRAIAAILAVLWAWTGLAYHVAFFSAVNPAAWGFGAVFVLGALWFAWVGVVRGAVQFGVRGGVRAATGWTLVVFALLAYPVLGFIVGHRYPAVPTFGAPCPTTIFTLGILLLAQAPAPRSLFVAPALWSAVGSVAAFQFGVVQDFGLLAAGVIGAAAMLGRRDGADRTSTQSAARRARR